MTFFSTSKAISKGKLTTWMPFPPPLPPKQYSKIVQFVTSMRNSFPILSQKELEMDQCQSGKRRVNVSPTFSDAHNGGAH